MINRRRYPRERQPKMLTLQATEWKSSRQPTMPAPDEQRRSSVRLTMMRSGLTGMNSRSTGCCIFSPSSSADENPTTDRTVKFETLNSSLQSSRPASTVNDRRQSSIGLLDSTVARPWPAKLLEKNWTPAPLIGSEHVGGGVNSSERVGSTRRQTPSVGDH